MFVVNEFRVKVFKNLSVYKRNSLDTYQARNSIYVYTYVCTYVNAYIWICFWLAQSGKNIPQELTLCHQLTCP